MGGGGGGEQPDETPAYKALATQSAEYFNRYRDVFVPLENQYIQSVLDVNKTSEYDKAAGSAGSAFTQAFSPKINEAQQNMLSAGVDPSSGAFKANTAGMYGDYGSQMGLGIADAQIGNTDRFLGGLTNVVKMGQGLASESMQGQIGLAQASEDKARSAAETAFSNRLQNQGALGTAAGMGAGLPYNRG